MPLPKDKQPSAKKKASKSPGKQPTKSRNPAGKSNPAKKPSEKPKQAKLTMKKAIAASNPPKSPKTSPKKPSAPKTASLKTLSPKNPGKHQAAKTLAAKTLAAKTLAAKTLGAKKTEEQKLEKKTVTAKSIPMKSSSSKKPPVEKTPLKSAAKTKLPEATSEPTAKTPIRIQPDDIIIPKKIPLPIPPKTNTDPKIVEKIRSAHQQIEQSKDLAQTPPPRKLTQSTPIPPVAKGQDRIVLLVRDPFWLHAHWDISRTTIDRAKAALIDQWHSVKPVLRLLKFDEVGTTESAETVYREIEIHGGVRNWYIDVDNPPSRFQVIMGYRAGNGRFYELVRSNSVTTPVPGSKDSFDDHWADIAKDAEKIYAQSGGYSEETNKGALAEVFEDRLKRTMELDVLSQFGSGAEGSLRKPRQFHFDVEAELLVYGTTHPDAHVSIGTEPVKVLADGTFSARLPFPDRRQVLPATARSRDGVDERTVVIAVERNTKVMEPLSIDAEDL